MVLVVGEEEVVMMVMVMRVRVRRVRRVPMGGRLVWFGKWTEWNRRPVVQWSSGPALLHRSLV